MPGTGQAGVAAVQDSSVEVMSTLQVPKTVVLAVHTTMGMGTVQQAVALSQPTVLDTGLPMEVAAVVRSAEPITTRSGLPMVEMVAGPVMAKSPVPPVVVVSQ